MNVVLQNVILLLKLLLVLVKYIVKNMMIHTGKYLSLWGKYGNVLYGVLFLLRSREINAIIIFSMY